MMNTDQSALVHKLRNNLNNIIMNAELGKLELSGQDARDRDKPSTQAAIACLDEILESCRKTADLVTTIPVSSDKIPDA